jgi:(p)ppGpp synthase/HD superfamily hydrolase
MHMRASVPGPGSEARTIREEPRLASIDDALRIAVRVHAGAGDKAGQPYILHPLRVMLRLTTEVERVVAILHDVVEDSEVTLDDLRAEGFSDEVVDAIDHVTRREGESYEAFIERIAPHPLARRVKIADLEDNMDVTRLVVLDERSAERMQRYLRSWQRLRAAE